MCIQILCYDFHLLLVFLRDLHFFGTSIPPKTVPSRIEALGDDCAMLPEACGDVCDGDLEQKESSAFA